MRGLSNSKKKLSSYRDMPDWLVIAGSTELRDLRLGHKVLKINTCMLIIFNTTIPLRVFENRVLRRVFGPKRDAVTGEWRKLHNEELSDLYSLPNIVRVVKS
jgi:hypothetical protein